MEKFHYESKKVSLLFSSAIMFVVCLCIFGIFTGQPSGTEKIFGLLIIPFAIWYLLLFLSVSKEQFSGIEFDNSKNAVSIYKAAGYSVEIPYDRISYITFETGSCIRYSTYTKISVYTNNNQYYKITVKAIYPKDEIITKLSSQLNIQHKGTVFLMP